MKLVQPLEATIRPAVQASVAAAVTYGVMLALGWHGQASWAVISALYVVQPHLDGTLSNAAARLAGTALGTAIGLGTLYGVGHWPPGVALSLAAAVLLLTTISGYHPGLRFGLIPAAVLILASRGDPVATAWARAAAIGLGALIGTAASLLVFPKAANRSVEQGLGRTVGRCGDLLEAAVDSLLGRREAAFDPINGDIRRTLEAASAEAGQALRKRERTGHRRRRPSPADLHHAVRSLWHSILMLERAGRQPLPVDRRQRLEGPLRRFARAARDMLRLIGHSLADGRPPPAAAGDRMRELQAAAADLPEQRGGGDRAGALAFAAGQVARDVAVLAELIEAPA